MTAETFTPGPWDYDADDFTLYQLETFEPLPVTEANARLKAAALGTYRQAFTHSGTGRHDPQPVPDPEWVTQARAAIAKATGADQ